MRWKRTAIKGSDGYTPNLISRTMNIIARSLGCWVTVEIGQGIAWFGVNSFPNMDKRLSYRGLGLKVYKS